MIYKVTYTKLAIMTDGSIGNISQGGNIAYLDCDLSEIEPILTEKWIDKNRKPIIENVARIEGDIVK